MLKIGRKTQKTNRPLLLKIFAVKKLDKQEFFNMVFSSEKYLKHLLSNSGYFFYLKNKIDNIHFNFYIWIE